MHSRDLRRAGAAFLLGSVFFAYAFTLRVAPGVMVDDLMRDFRVSAAILGNLSAFYFYAYASLQIPVGLLIDRFGPRRLATAAAAVVAAGSVLFATSETLGLAYAGRFAVGIGCAFSWACALAVVNQWFPTRFAVLAGVSQFIAMGGAVLGQAPLAAAVTSFGWRSSMLALAAFGVALSITIYLVTRDRNPAHGGGARALGAGAGRVLGNPQTWLAAGFALSMAVPMLAFSGLWGVPFLTTAYDLSRTDAAGITSLLFIGNGVGGIALGWWSDHICRRRLPMACGAALSVAAQAALIFIPGLSAVALGTISFAAGLGGSSLVLGFAAGREHNSPASVGLTIGVINTATTGSGALFQPLVGWLLDLRWSGATEAGVRIYEAADFRFALGVLPLTGLLGLALVFFIRETWSRPAASQ